MSSTSLKDAFRAHPVSLDNKQVDLRSLRELPESFKWISCEDDCFSTSSHGNSVPLIDLHDDNALASIEKACRTWGVFQVINHGFPPPLLREMEKLCQRLFKLPIHRKLKAARQPNGVTGYGVARISSFFSKFLWSEGFTIVGSPSEHFRLLWPHDFAQYCELMEAYENEMRGLSGRLMWLMLGALGINVKDTKLACQTPKPMESCAAVQLNYYPSCPDPDHAMGLAAHTDSTLFTILYQNSTAGLQVLREGTGWVTVPPVPGGLVINVGDLLHILTNGLYKSALHRARVNRTRHRISVAYLFGPPSEDQIFPLPQLVGPNERPLYRSITWNEYLGKKAKYFNKALSSVRS